MTGPTGSSSDASLVSGTRAELISAETSSSTFMDIDMPSDEDAEVADTRATEVPPCNQEHMATVAELEQAQQGYPVAGDGGVLDINVLLQSCIQGASSMLKDIGTERTTKRIQLLLGLMEDATQQGRTSQMKCAQMSYVLLMGEVEGEKYHYIFLPNISVQSTVFILNQ